MLLAAAVLAPALRTKTESKQPISAPAGASAWIVRGGAILLAVASLVAIAIPLAMTNAERSSQAAAAGRDYGPALADARAAERLEPGAASPQVQIALVLEAQGDAPAALAAARRAASNEPADWSTWLIVSRLEAETGHAVASVSAYRRAESLNPRSPIFAQ
jgi:tetratricopeptide (TPR) repeat protein